MKNRLIHAAVLLLAVISFAACDKENQPLFSPEELTKEFGTNETQLSLSYGGEPLIGKPVKFQTQDSQTASITLTDVIPGEAKTVIDQIQLAETDTQYTFSGSATTPTKAVIAYTGKVSNNELTLALDVTMPASQWAKTYELSPLTLGNEKYWVYSRKGLKPPYKYVYEEKIRTNTVLTSAGYVSIQHTLPAAGTTAQDTINACTITTFTDKFRSALGCVLPQVIQTISLEKDGNITAKYSSGTIQFDQSYLINPQATTPETIAQLIAGRTWTQSPKNLAYWLEKEGHIYIKLNIAAIISQAMSDNHLNGNALAGVIQSLLNGEPAVIKEMLKALNMGITNTLANMSDATFATVLGWINNGIPIETSTENGHTYFYPDRKVLDILIAEVPALLPELEKLLPAESADMAVSTINNILKGYPYTSQFKIGLDLTGK